MKTDPEQPGVTQAPSSREGCQGAEASWAWGKEAEQRPRKPSSSDPSGLCFPQDFLCFSCEQYPLNRSLTVNQMSF